MPLFSFIMWHALKPFRRLTTMVNPQANHFGDMHGSMSSARQAGMHRGKQVAATGAAALTGGATGAAVAVAMDDDDDRAMPDRAEARPSPRAPTATPFAPQGAPMSASTDAHGAPQLGGPTVVSEQVGANFEARSGHHRTAHASSHEPAVASLPEGFVPRPTSEGLPLPPTEPEWDDGEAVYPIYRPSDEHTDDVA